MSVLPYGCTTWTLGEKARWSLNKIAGYHFGQILEAVPYKTAVVRTTQILQTIQIRRAGHCGRSQGELISNVHLKAPMYELTVWRNCQMRWPIGTDGEIETKKSVLSARLDVGYYRAWDLLMHSLFPTLCLKICYMKSSTFTRAGCDTRSIFKQSLIGLISEVSFS